MTGRFNGYIGPIQQSWKVKFSPSTGGQSEIRIQGFDVNQMLNLAGAQARAGIECELSFQHNMAELTLCTSNPTYQGFGSVFNSVSDKWEVAVDDEKPIIFDNPSYLSIFQTLNATYGVNVDQQFAQVIKSTSENGKGTWYDLYSALKQYALTDITGNPIQTHAGFNVYLSSLIPYLSPPAYAPGLLGQQGLQFFAQEYYRGRTNYAHSKYTLKHTTLAPDTYSSNVTEFGIEQIYSISQLLSECQNGNLWILPLPGYLVYKILSYPIPVNMPPTYQWGALKMRSNAVVAARGRIEISQTYLIDAIAVPTYGVKS